jgi:iron complex transport system substrate-binding protein
VRIVSLLASATEIVCALEAGEMLVGRSHECDNPHWVKQLPACSAPAFDISVSSGDIDKEVRRRLRTGEPLYHLDGELIRELRPDLLITQAHCEVCAVTPDDVLRSGGPAARQVALSAVSLEEIFRGILWISREIGVEERGKALVHREQQCLNVLGERAAGFPRPTVVLLEWADPLFAMGNWGPELVEIANGELLLGKKGEYSAAISAEQLLGADPEYLIVAPCGFNLERSLLEQTVLERFPWWRELGAVRKGNVAFADGNLFFNRSGMTISKTAEIMAEILHGGPFQAGNEGVHWRRMGPPVARDERRMRVSHP